MTEHRTPPTDRPAGPGDRSGHGSGPERPYLPGMGSDRLLPLYDPFTRLVGARRLHQRLVDQADVRAGMRVLEIGCGTGNLALLIRHQHPDSTVTGLDPDPRALALAGRKARRAGVSIRLDRGFADELPYPDASVDRVFSALMFHHLDAADRPAALREIRRVLAPGGSLHVVDLDGKEQHAHLPLAWLLRRGRRHGAAADARHAAHSGDELTTLIRAAGLTDARVTGGGSTPFGHYALYRADR